MAIDSLTFTFTLGRQWTAQKNLTGGLKPVGHSDQISVTHALGTAVANAVAGGANHLSQQVYDVPAGGTLTIDLRALTNIIQEGSQVLARVKLIVFELLSTAQGGSACSQVTIGNHATTPHQLWHGADAHTSVLKNGRFIAAGGSDATGEVVDASNLNVLVTNNDGAIIGKLRATIVGGTS